MDTLELKSILFHAYSESIEDKVKTNVDPVKNVYGNFENSLDHENLFPFLTNGIFDSGSINFSNIQNAATLYTCMEIGDNMKVFAIADAILKYVVRGNVDIQSPSSATRIYNYMKLRDNRTTEDERAMFYKQVFDVGDGEMMKDMVSNQDFYRLWEDMMTEVIRYIDKYEGSDNPDKVSKTGVEQAIINLQHNLSRATRGMVKLYTAEIYAHLEDAIMICSSPEITDQLGQGVNRDIWNVIERVSMQEFNYIPNITSLKAVAEYGRKIILTLAKYSSATFTDSDFQDFIEDVDWYIKAQGRLHSSEDDESTNFDQEDGEFENADEEFEMEENWNF